MDNKVGVNEFVKRQTKSSGKTYTDLSFDEIAKFAEDQINDNKFKNGYRDGVIIVEIKNNLAKRFVCPFVEITEDTKLKAEVAKRRNNEESYIRIKALNGEALKIGKVELILYRNDILKETNENTTNKDWELISFHGIPDKIKEMPMGPVTMMRNQLKLTGGTKGEYTSEEWAKSVNFWQKYVIKETNLS